MDRLKLILLLFSVFTFFTSIAWLGRNISFYFDNKDMYHQEQNYFKKYVLIDSTFTVVKSGSKSSNEYVYNYGLSKTYDNYKTVFNLNVPDGSAVVEKKMHVEAFENPLNSNQYFYYAWIHKQKGIGYICNENEKTIKYNWIYLHQLLEFQVNLLLLIFSIIVFYWLEVYKIFEKGT